MTTLNELAVKLQSYIINSQLSDKRNQHGVSKSRYNNLKLSINTTLQYPNIVVSIGISEATYNIEDGTKTDGSLGPDEKYVYKWIGNPYIEPALQELYLAATELVDLKEEQEELQEELQEEYEDKLKSLSEGSAGESDIDVRQPRRKKKSLRSLMMPAQLPQPAADISGEAVKHKHKIGDLESFDESELSENEIYEENQELEVYSEEGLESLADEAKKSDFMDFMRKSFGFKKNKGEE